MQRICADSIKAEMHVEVAAPRRVVRAGFAVVLIETDRRWNLRCDRGRGGLADYIYVCGNHFSPFARRRLGSHFVTPAPRLIRLRKVPGGSLIICWYQLCISCRKACMPAMRAVTWGCFSARASVASRPKAAIVGSISRSTRC